MAETRRKGERHDPEPLLESAHVPPVAFPSTSSAPAGETTGQAGETHATTPTGRSAGDDSGREREAPPGVGHGGKGHTETWTQRGCAGRSLYRALAATAAKGSTTTPTPPGLTSSPEMTLACSGRNKKGQFAAFPR